MSVSNSSKSIDSPKSQKLVRLTHLVQKLAVSRSTIYTWLDARSPYHRPHFPRPFRLGMARAIFWRESDVDVWIELELAKSNNSKSVTEEVAPNPYVLNLKSSVRSEVS